MLKRFAPVLFALTAIAAFAPSAGAATTAVEAGAYGSCAIDSGAAYCWSGTKAGAVSLDIPPGAPDTSAPTLFAGLTSGVTDISLARNHGCAVVNGGAHCFGSSEDLQLGDPDVGYSNVPIPVRGIAGGVTDISAADTYSCAVVSSAVKCWGQIDGLTVGDYDYYSQTAETIPGLTTGATAVDTGNRMACAIISGAVKCWGIGYLGDGEYHPDPELVTVTGLTSNVTKLDVNGQGACAIQAGALRCWGTSAYGFNGDGSITTLEAPITPTGLSSGVTAVTVGPNVNCAVAAGVVKCWGSGPYGQLGSGVGLSTTPIDVPGLGGSATAVATNAYVSCAVVAGAAKCWGLNKDGMLGDGTLINALTPLGAPELATDVTDIAAGSQGGCAVVSGAGKCWGNLQQPTSGNAADGFESASPATIVGLETGVTDIDVDTYGCAIVTGTVKCWDRPVLGNPPAATAINGGSGGATDLDVNYNTGCTVIGGVEKCGSIVGTYERELIPVAGLPATVTKVATGASHKCAIVAGAAKCWGTNYYGELGIDNGYEGTNIPQQVAGLTSGVTAIAAAQYFSCAVVSGAAKCWGSGEYGQLGDGEMMESTVPVQVEGLESGVTAISTGDDHACAIKSGDAYCWGSGFEGELGNNNRFGWTIPVKVQGLSNPVSQVSAGGSHSCAVAAGAGYCWGANSHGQLGMGTTLGPRAPGNLTAPDDAPSVGLVKPTVGATVLETQTPVVIASANATTLECKIDDGSYTACPTSYTNLSEGFHTIRVLGQNAAGRLAIADGYFSVDSRAPKPTIISPANGSTVPTSTPALYFELDDDYAWVDCTLDGVPLLDEYGDEGYCDYIETLPPLSVGKHTLVVTAYDYFGRSNSATSVFNFGTVITPPPTKFAPTAKTGLTGKAKRSGKSLKVGYSFSFAVPTGVAPAEACSGKVKVAAKKGKKKIASATATLKVKGKRCLGKTSFKLPRSTSGKRVTFDAYFPGNSVMLPTHNVNKLKIKR